MVGSPNRAWRHFLRPRLRKCPFEAEIEFGEQLGFGIDGIVWKVNIGGRTFALKVVSLLALLYSLLASVLSTDWSSFGIMQSLEGLTTTRSKGNVITSHSFR
jgi:hypothetical protein